MRKARTNEVIIYQLLILRNRTSRHTTQDRAKGAWQPALLPLSADFSAGHTRRLFNRCHVKSIPCTFTGASTSELVPTCTSLTKMERAEPKRLLPLKSVHASDKYQAVWALWPSFETQGLAWIGPSPALLKLTEQEEVIKYTQMCEITAGAQAWLPAEQNP